MRFLSSLNESFSHIQGHILLMEPLLPIKKVLIVQEEQQLGL